MSACDKKRLAAFTRELILLAREEVTGGCNDWTRGAEEEIEVEVDVEADVEIEVEVEIEEVEIEIKVDVDVEAEVDLEKGLG